MLVVRPEYSESLLIDQLSAIVFSMGPANNQCGGENIHPITIGLYIKLSGGVCPAAGTWQINAGITPTTTSYYKHTTTFGGGANGTESVYVNSVLDKQATMTTNTPVSSANKLCIGWVRDDGASFTMSAKVKSIMFFNGIVISSTDMTQLD